MMRSALCAMILAVCLVALQCTATAAGDQGSQRSGGQKSGGQSEGVVTTTTTAANAQQSSQELRTEGAEGQVTREDGVQSNPAAAGQTTTTTIVAKLVPEQLSNPGNGYPKEPTAEEAANKLEVKGDGVKADGVNTEGGRVVQSPAKTSGGQSSSEGRGQTASEPTVTSPTTIVQNNNGENAEVSQTGNSGDKGTHQQQTLKSTTTTTAEQTASTETSTTSSVAPTKAQSTSPKRSTIPQNLNNKDSGSYSSLLLAFTILATLAVIPAAPAY